MKKNKKESLILGRILQKIAPRIGARVILEPEWEIVGQITFKTGRRSYFRYNTLDLNPVGASDIAKDKDYANFFMKAMSYPIVPGSKTFFSDEWAKAIGSPRRNIDAAYRHARKLKFPVIVKPNSGSQGTAVSLVHNKHEFYRAVRVVFKSDRIVLVQQLVHGKDYRLVVLDKKIISAYERIPLNVIGDGNSSIGKLLETKRRQFVASSRDTQIRMSDPRIKMKLAHQGLTFRSVPAKGQKLYLLDNANLSTGGDSVDVTDKVHPAFRKLAIKITRDMGLRLCGVDLMVEGNISQKPNEFWVLEVNAAPGLDHYARMGRAQEKIVEALYLEVLKHIER
ncbi:MAG: cyanophycin synthetase [bacterium]|nr:cyanophycin synthetase [bacterium]